MLIASHLVDSSLHVSALFLLGHQAGVKIGQFETLSLGLIGLFIVSGLGITTVTSEWPAPAGVSGCMCQDAAEGTSG